MSILAINMQERKRDWNSYNDMLVRRGKVVTILIEPSLVDSDSLKKINKNKVGRPFRFATGLISAAFAVKCALRLGYRQIQGFVEDISGKLNTKVPNFRTIWWRIDSMKTEGVKFNTKGRHLVVAIDSTGLRPVNDGEYRKMKYDQRKEWTKLHIVVGVKTKEILNISITKGNVNDSTEFENLMEPIASKVATVLVDKAYDTVKIFQYCDKNNIFAGIPVKLNATNSSNKCRQRRDAIEEQLGFICKPGSMRLNRYLTAEKKAENQERWKLKVGYGRRSLVESAFSRYKRVLGENIFSRKKGNVEKELIAKVNLLNKFATM
jgi:Transposase DDE domain